jgi:hypothetical protein
MRKLFWAAALLVGLATAAPASAQSRVLLPIGSFNGTSTVNEVVDVTKSGVPIAQPQTFSRSFNLLNFLPNISSFRNKTIFGQSAFPTPEQMPGADYMRYFGYHRPVPIRY